MWYQCQCLWELARGSPEEWEEKYKHECIEKFRDVYRTTWGRPEVALVLASVSSSVP